jgi:hypothetical protein
MEVGRAAPGQRPVVLVVEDEGLIRINAMAMVEDAGFEAIAASDADEAIRNSCGCGAPPIRDAICLNTNLLRESLASRHSRHINLIPHA